MCKDFAASFPSVYSLECMVSFLNQRAKRSSVSGSSAGDKETPTKAEPNVTGLETRGPITNRGEFKNALTVMFTSMLMVIAGHPSIAKMQMTAAQINEAQARAKVIP